MEPDMKRSRIRRRCPRMKRDLGQSSFVLGYHAQTMSERERERGGRETNRKAPSIESTKKGNEKVRMHE